MGHATTQVGNGSLTKLPFCRTVGYPPGQVNDTIVKCLKTSVSTGWAMVIYRIPDVTCCFKMQYDESIYKKDRYGPYSRLMIGRISSSSCLVLNVSILGNSSSQITKPVGSTSDI